MELGNKESLNIEWWESKPLFLISCQITDTQAHNFQAGDSSTIAFVVKEIVTAGDANEIATSLLTHLHPYLMLKILQLVKKLSIWNLAPPGQTDRDH